MSYDNKERDTYQRSLARTAKLVMLQGFGAWSVAAAAQFFSRPNEAAGLFVYGVLLVFFGAYVLYETIRAAKLAHIFQPPMVRWNRF